MPSSASLLILPLLFVCAAACCQPDTTLPAESLKEKTDTSLLAPARLGEQDLVPFLQHNEQVQIISGSRFPISAGDLPFSVYVITKEEIRRNGYETLVDALKMAPGIRVSQPGNAIEGETFLMRGLVGNTYAKILINDVPIKPVFVGGMPIGAQLPIKEAERIEIIYGAGAALYGSDAAAGIINIITRQSEKPVFMQADLSVGQGLYSSVNVQFGGRLGRDRQIIKFFAYGSNVLFERRNIFFDQNFNYNPQNYFLLGGADDTSYVASPNYSGTAARPLLTNTPHLSRKFGVTLNFRGITLSVESMYRRDHSSLGLNPLAVSYANPLTYTGEGIWRVNLNLFKSKYRANRKTDFTYLRYDLDNRSSMLMVQNRLSRELRVAAETEAFRQHSDSVEHYAPILYAQTQARFLNGLRYLYGSSDEFRIEHVRNYRILKRFSLTAGTNVKFGWGVPLVQFLSRPSTSADINYRSFGDTPSSYNQEVFPLSPQLEATGEFNAFSQIFYNGEKLNLAGGIYFSALTDILDAGLAPRLAGLFKLSEKMRLRASWGRAYRAPSQYYRSISYQVRSDSLESLIRNFSEFEAEETEAFEFGLRSTGGQYVSWDLTFFSNKTDRLIRYVQILQSELFDTVYATTLGYENDLLSRNSVRGGQLQVRFSNIFKDNFLEGQYNLTWSKTKTREQTGTSDLDRLPDYAGKIHQMRLTLRPVRDVSLLLDGLVLSKPNLPTVNGERKPVFTLDAVLRYAFTERFDAYVKIINVLDRKYAGIRATGTPDDLMYNPQSGFWLRLGMNYFLE